MIPVLDEVLKIGNKLIPDKDGQMELEKKVLEVNEKLVKSNKTLLEKIVPMTFPLTVWIICVYAIFQLVIGYISLRKDGTWLTIPIPKELAQLAFIFACGLMGKWNVKELFTGKK